MYLHSLITGLFLNGPKEVADGALSQATYLFHIFVTDIATIAVNLMELLSVVIIVYTAGNAFYKLLKRKDYARVYLLHGQSLGLTFKLGSEILRTITVRNMDEIWQIFLLIIIKACMALLIAFELRSAEKEETGTPVLSNFANKTGAFPGNLIDKIRGRQGSKPCQCASDDSNSCQDNHSKENTKDLNHTE